VKVKKEKRKKIETREASVIKERNLHPHSWMNNP
jgi:hypothetical protein